MGYDVFTSIMCPVHDQVYNKEIRNYEPSPFMEIAKKHLDILKDDGFTPKLCFLFLEAVTAGKCIFNGTKGEGLCWAAEGNGSNAKDIADHLKLYFLDMWQNRIIPAYHGVD